MSNINNYVLKLQKSYQDGTGNHEHHNSNPDYKTYLIKDIASSPTAWEGKSFLDFGCGKGRNVSNVSSLSNFLHCDGVDISEANIKHCIDCFDSKKSMFFVTSGDNLSFFLNASYDYVLSTIVFQHICSRTLRNKLFSEIFRILKQNGIFSLQMGFGSKPDGVRIYDYFADNYIIDQANGFSDCCVSSESDLVNDLKVIGFSNFETIVRPSYSDSQHPNWIYIKSIK